MVTDWQLIAAWAASVAENPGSGDLNSAATATDPAEKLFQLDATMCGLCRQAKSVDRSFVDAGVPCLVALCVVVRVLAMILIARSERG